MSRSSKPQQAPQATVKPTGSTSWKDRLAPEDYEELENTFRVFD